MGYKLTDVTTDPNIDQQIYAGSSIFTGYKRMASTETLPANGKPKVDIR